MLRELDAESGPRFALRSARVQVEGKYFRFSGSRARVRGVTYGPFVRGSDGEPFPTARQVRADLERMHSAGINSVRTYCVPPPKLLEQVEDQGMWTLIDVPWRKHVCFLQSRRLRNEAQKLVRDAARLGRRSARSLRIASAMRFPPTSFAGTVLALSNASWPRSSTRQSRPIPIVLSLMRTIR